MWIKQQQNATSPLNYPSGAKQYENNCSIDKLDNSNIEFADDHGLDISNNTIANLSHQLNAPPVPKKRYRAAKKKGSVGL